MKKINRVKKYREFQEIISLRKFKRNDLFVVYYRNNDFHYARVGILVRKKNGNAVTRVKIKRQVREIVDSVLEYKEVSKDLIIVINTKYNTLEFQRNKDLLVDLLKSIKEIK